ncbi:MAG: tRNA (adenosine(37)-N6)-dimethylallyltransferase MiaA, partial [Pseudomonadota bacterium]
MDTQATSLVKLKDKLFALKDAYQPLVVIAGATATGKSALALDLADHMPSTIINADSMQVYDAIPILTAQPTAQERAQAPHALYGFLPPDDACSAARWSALALQAIQSAWADRRLPILVGGTGLYLRSLLMGIADIPDIDPAIRTSVRARLEAEGPAPLYEQLAALDPDGAARLSPNDRQRIARALEVVLATDTPLAEWQKQ